MASLTKRKIKSTKYQGTITSRIYYITWYDRNGTKKFKSTGCVRRDDAEVFFRKWQKNKNNISVNILLSEMIPEILKYVKLNFRYGTYLIYKNTLNNFLLITKDKPIKLINLQDVEFYKSIRKQSISNTTINIELRTLKAAFNRAVEFEYIDYNPVRKIKQLETFEKPLKIFSNEQIKFLIANIKNKAIRKAVLIAIYTGCRLNEIVNLRYGNIVEDDLIIYNNDNFQTKTGKNRTIPISQELQKEIFECNIINFPENYLLGRKYTKSYITRRFKFYLRKFEFSESLTFHCLRHTFATQLINAGTPLQVIKELLGHKNIKTTEIYLHSNSETKLKAVNSLSL